MPTTLLSNSSPASRTGRASPTTIASFRPASYVGSSTIKATHGGRPSQSKEGRWRARRAEGQFRAGRARARCACTVCARFLTAAGLREHPAAVGAVVDAAVPLAGIAIAIRAQVVYRELVRLLVESYRSRRVVPFSTKRLITVDQSTTLSLTMVTFVGTNQPERAL
eukprot:scaffold25933_cov64-Phaeocystis_antarctica.AAC.1